LSFEQNRDPFIPPPPPPQPPIGDPLYPPYVLQQKAQQVKDDMRTSLILGLLGLFCCGFILGYFAFRRADDAIETIDIYGVLTERRSMAVALKVLGIFDIVGSILVIIGRFAIVDW
jgi:hypothetical protein